MSRPNSVFVNRVLNLKKIKVVGFDMDHTLVRYHTRRFEELVFRSMIEHFVVSKGYPAEIANFKFNFESVIRGLVIDINRGNLLKLSTYSKVRQAMHGMTPIKFTEMNRIYRNLVIDLNDPAYLPIDTQFSIASASLFAALVDFSESNKELLPTDYIQFYEDIQETVNSLHGGTTLKAKVIQNPEHYVLQDQDLIAWLQRLKRSGKKIIIITNSDYAYTEKLLNYTMGPFLEEHWSQFFDLVVVFAEKPSFFTGKRPFLKVIPDTQHLCNWNHPLEEKSIFQGGNAKVIEKHFGVDGDEVLYFGDHIFGDVVQLKKSCNWRTALIVDELADEIASLQKGAHIQSKIDQLMNDKEQAEQAYYHESDREKRNYFWEQINQINQAIGHLIPDHQALFNPFWGPIMRAGQEESRFAGQVEKYACIYTDRLANMNHYSTKHYFRPLRRALPHELL